MMTAILVTVFPNKGPHVFAFLRTITKASRTFESLVWALYNMVYHHQAANRGSLHAERTQMRNINCHSAERKGHWNKSSKHLETVL